MPALSRVVALQRGQNEAAFDLIEQSLGQDGDNAEAHFNIGLAYAALGRSATIGAPYRASRIMLTRMPTLAMR